MEPSSINPMSRLKERFQQEIAPQLAERFGYLNALQIPRVTKVVVNMGVGSAVESGARVETAARDLGAITGQKPRINKARTSVAGFRLREGMPIGCTTTLRGARMYEFLDRLISIVLPRIRDFRGLSPKLDGWGNFTLGLDEQAIFPEIDLDKVENVQGMDITIVTSAKTDEEGHALLSGFGMPFRTAEDQN